MKDEEITIIETVPDAIFQADKALIDQQIATAHAFPRNIKRATDNSLAIVTMDKETAETCTYAIPRGGKAITGPSVYLAKIIAQQWGNMRVEAKVISVDAKEITSHAVCWDLESNLAIKVEVKRSIVGKLGRFNSDMVTVTGNAANSIALRNSIFAVVPKAVVDKVYKAVKETITGDVSDENKLKAKRRQVVDGLKGTYNVTESEVLSAVGKASLDHLTADDLVVLIGVGTAIKDGDTNVDYAFKGKKDGKPDINKEEERIALLLKDAKTLAELKKYEKNLPKSLTDLYNERSIELKDK